MFSQSPFFALFSLTSRARGKHALQRREASTFVLRPARPLPLTPRRGARQSRRRQPGLRPRIPAFERCCFQTSESRGRRQERENRTEEDDMWIPREYRGSVFLKLLEYIFRIQSISVLSISYARFLRYRCSNITLL